MARPSVREVSAAGVTTSSSSGVTLAAVRASPTVPATRSSTGVPAASTVTFLGVLMLKESPSRPMAAEREVDSLESGSLRLSCVRASSTVREVVHTVRASPSMVNWS